ncbi:MAG TPA: hypothetical protein VEM96_17220 [Pyrinomonadaceae bacterium]|nr:hypothetical protein [Pyrinomonadaceae bacterium]
MISRIDFDKRPFSPGETRPIAIEGSAPIGVRVSCFIFKPPPPDYKPCDACGVLNLNSGEVAQIRADRRTFAEKGGELHLEIIDADGDGREIRVKVAAFEAENVSQLAEMSEREDA